MKKNIACLIYGNQLNYLDHLAPLCYFFNISLITNNEEIAAIAKKYYPKISIQYIDNLNIHFYVVQNFDIIISCITQGHFDSYFKFHQDLLNKKNEIIWCPHGNSDKGKTCLFFESLKNEKFVLVYGKKMIDILKEKQVFHSIKNIFKIGNYRLEHYKLFKKYFDQIIKKELLDKISADKITILYAPTWKDLEDASSFETYFDSILKTAPSRFNLIIKLHPNLYEKFFTHIEILKAKYEKKHIFFLENFPLIYPLLNVVDVYMGDFSSIGYDFLYFQKPMFFLQPLNIKLKSDLFKCGHVISEKNIFEAIEQNIKKKIFRERMKKLYNDTFEPNINLQNIKNKIF